MPPTKSKVKDNGSKPIPNKVEFLDEFLPIAREVAFTYGVTLDQALMLMLLCEMHCIHSHFDQGVVVHGPTSSS